MSELTAVTRLIEAGYTVYEPVCCESHDLLIREPACGRFLQAQVKTVRTRVSRSNARVIQATKHDGRRYGAEEVDVIIGVHGADAYMLEHTGNAE